MLAAAPGTSASDNYGNVWSIVDSRLQVISARNPSISQPIFPATSLADPPGFVVADDHGFVWAASAPPAAPASIVFCNPRAIVDTETPDNSEEAEGMTAFEMAELMGYAEMAELLRKGRCICFQSC